MAGICYAKRRKQGLASNKKRLKRPYRIMRGLYRTVVVLSATVVALYLAFTVAIRQPNMAQAANQPVDDQQVQTQAEETGPDIRNAGSKVRKDRCYTFLVAASDDGNGNADTIMVMTYDVPNQKIGVISIPRDTVVKTTRKMPKINAAYGQGIDVLRSEVSTLVGFPIDFTLTVDMEAFVKLVDAVGGVEFDVPIEMYYDDPAQDLSIHYMPGLQTLQGQQALEVVRFRKNADGTGYPDSDIGRTRTQQQMLKTLAGKVISWNNIFKVKEFVNIFSNYVETDLGLRDMLYFANEASKVDVGAALSGATLPGDGTKTYKGYAWCYALDREASLELLNQNVNPYTEPLTMDDVGFVVVN